MEVQVFGVKKSADTRKALRFFAERRVKTHFVDLNERAASPGELRRFVQKFGLDRLIDRDSKRYDELGLRTARLSDERWMEKTRRRAVAAEHAARAQAERADDWTGGTGLEELDGEVTQLAVSGVGVEFGATTLFKDITFTVARRAIAGESSAGTARARRRCFVC